MKKPLLLEARAENYVSEGEPLCRDLKAEDQRRERSTFCCLPVRYIIAILASIGFGNAYGLRINLNVAIVAMVNDGAILSENATTSIVDIERDKDLQGFVLSAFTIGYILPQIPSGWLVGKYGAKWPLAISLAFSAVLAFFSPYAAKCGPSWLISLRIIQGICQGIDLPAVYQIASRWAPPLERSRFLSIIYTGICCGSFGYSTLSGYLAASDWGWPSLFYVTGSITFVWLGFWLIFAYDSPETHPWISSEEKEYIQMCFQNTNESFMHDYRVPWKDIWLSLPVWAISAASFAENLSFNLVFTMYPTYLHDILDYKIENSGLTSALPYLAQIICLLLAGIVADFFLAKGLKVVTTRKLFTISGLLLSAAFLVGGGLAGENEILAITMLTLSLATYGLHTGGVFANRSDLSHNFTGVIAGISNCFGGMGATLAPIIAGKLTDVEASHKQWMKVFYIVSGILVLNSIIYGCFASGELQRWDNNATDTSLKEAEGKKQVKKYND